MLAQVAAHLHRVVAERRVDDLRELAQRLDALVVGAARERRREGREDGAE